MSEELKSKASPLTKMTDSAELTNLLIVGLCDQIEETNRILICIKDGHKVHRGWKSKVTLITLGFACVVWAVEFFTGVPVLTKVLPFLKGLIL